MVSVIESPYHEAIEYTLILELLNFRYSELRKISNDVIKLYSANEPIIENRKQLSKLLGCSEQKILKRYQEVVENFNRVDFDYHVLSFSDDTYPALLKKTEYPPPFLFVRGNVELLRIPTISVVGTRNPTADNLKRASKISLMLTKKGFVVASGLAKGIDTAAHKGAIKVGGFTTAVIGTPLDSYYPKENANLQEKIAESHLLISQFPFGHPTRKYCFPQRNYVMSGISYATVIVEASETSGALIQARQCLKQNRKLFLMQNLLDNKALKWPRTYIKRGAIPLKEIDDICEHIKDLEIDNESSSINSEQLAFFDGIQ